MKCYYIIRGKGPSTVISICLNDEDWEMVFDILRWQDDGGSNSDLPDVEIPEEEIPIERHYMGD